MNILTSPLLIDRQLAAFFHNRYLNTGALISFSSASRGLHAVYRKALMERIKGLFNLAVDMPQEQFGRAVFNALTSKITAETDEIAKEMDSKADWIKEVMRDYGVTPMPENDDTLLRRQDLFSKVKSVLCRPDIPLRYAIGEVTTQASLHFLLSCARRLGNQRLDRVATGRLLAVGPSDDGYLTDAICRLKHEWPRMNGCEQAEAVTTFGNILSSIANPASHQGLQIVRDFVSDRTSGWASTLMRNGCSFIVESAVEGGQEDWKRRSVISLLEKIADPEFRCSHPPILKAYYETLDAIINSSSEDQVKIYLAYLQENSI